MRWRNTKKRSYSKIRKSKSKVLLASKKKTTLRIRTQNLKHKDKSSKRNFLNTLNQFKAAKTTTIAFIIRRECKVSHMGRILFCFSQTRPPPSTPLLPNDHLKIIVVKYHYLISSTTKLDLICLLWTIS